MFYIIRRFHPNRVARVETSIARVETGQYLENECYSANINCATQNLQWVIAQQPKKHSSSAFGESFGS